MCLQRTFSSQNLFLISPGTFGGLVQWFLPWSWQFLWFSNRWVASAQPMAKPAVCGGDWSQGGATGLSSLGMSPGQRWDVPLAVTPWWWGILSLQHMNHFPIWEVLCAVSVGPQHTNELPLSLGKEVVHRAAGEKWVFFPEGRHNMHGPHTSTHEDGWPVLDTAPV